MANAFQGAPGWNNAAGLTVFPESPDYDGIAFPRPIDTPSGLTYFDGKPFALLRFPDIMDEAVAVATLTVLGLTGGYFGTPSVRVTVRLPDENMATFHNYNGIAVRWIPGQGIRHAYCWYERPEILVKRLVAI